MRREQSAADAAVIQRTDADRDIVQAALSIVDQAGESWNRSRAPDHVGDGYPL